MRNISNAGLPQTGADSAKANARSTTNPIASVDRFGVRSLYRIFKRKGSFLIGPEYRAIPRPLNFGPRQPTDIKISGFLNGGQPNSLTAFANHHRGQVKSSRSAHLRTRRPDLKPTDSK
jgi:hypothetical protein